MSEIDSLKQEIKTLKEKVKSLESDLRFYAEYPDEPDCTSTVYDYFRDVARAALGLPLDEDNDPDKYNEE